MCGVVRLAWLLTAPLATAINLRKSLSLGEGWHGELTTPARTNVSSPQLLPAGIVPKRYDIHLRPDYSTLTYVGEETITVDVVEDGMTVLVLHAKKLHIEAAFFLWHFDADTAGDPDDSPPRKFGPTSVRYDLPGTKVVMRFPYAIPRGEGRIYLRFMGRIGDEMSGLYRSSYADAQGNTKVLLATQMQPISARTVFPCWDEPARKAVFKITVTVPAQLQAISNMPVEKEHEVSLASKRVTFAESPVMSTYLLALVVGEFDYVEAATGHGVQVRVYTPKGRSGEGKFALGVASSVLDRFDDYFGVPYPLPKLDLVSLPEFGAGAMENWGLITFRECLILIDEHAASAQQKQEVGVVAAHELAHQWFGNLVTMAWWDELWLNEAFATWMEYCGLEKIFPEYDLWSQFRIGVFEEGLELDELVTSHPILAPLDRAEEASEAFDAITYKKGAAVINMLYAYIGKKAFRKGLYVYLTRHAYSSAKTVDLWQAWSEVTGLDIHKIMDEWTQRANFPYVRVTFQERAEAAGEAILEVEQLPFVDQPVAEKYALWSIPITGVGVGSSAAPTTVLMDTGSMQFRVPVPTGNAVTLNVGRPSPIRVLYGEALAGRLRDAIRSKALPPTERATLLYDSHRMMYAGRNDPQDLATLLGAYRDEDTYVVWMALHEALVGMNRLMDVGGFLSHTFFRPFAGDLVDYGWAATNVGWESPAAATGHATELLRGVMVDLLTKFRGKKPTVQAEAHRRYAAYLSSPTAAAAAAVLPAAIRTPVLQLVLKNGGHAEYAEIVSLYNRSSNAAQLHILRAIGYASSAELKLAALQWSISGAVKTQDAHYVFGSVSESNQEGLLTAWTFLKEHIMELSKKLPTPLLNKIITYSTSGFCTRKHEEEVAEFFGMVRLPRSERTLATATEKIRECVGALGRYRYVMTFFPLLGR